MKKIVSVLLVLLMLLSFSACSSGGTTTDDSYKNKTWDQMNGAEKEKTRQDISKAIERSKAAGADWG